MLLLGVSSHAVCVRDDASSGSKTMAVELQAVGAEARMGVTVGILDVRMEILPKPDMGTTIPQVLSAAVTCAAFCAHGSIWRVPDGNRATAPHRGSPQ